MGRAYIEDVVSRLNDSRSAARKEALDELKIILQQSKGTSGIDSLGDDGFHQIFEALFNTVRHERAPYISSTRSSKSPFATNRLRDCAVVFRLAVELGVSKVRSKTANSVIDHVVDTLPLVGDVFCQPLVDDYLKILRTILEYAAHVEHLRDPKWCDLVDFVTRAISRYTPDDDDSAEIIPSTLSQQSRNGSIMSLRVSQSSASRATTREASKSVEDLLLCLDRLSGATNAPAMSRATSIMDCMTRFLNSTSPGGSLHQIAFGCVNNTLKRAVTEDSRLAKQVVLRLIPIIRKFWSSKHALLRDEMLTTLVLSIDIVRALPATDPGDHVCSSLCNLFDVVATEYSRRNERDILQLDEVLFHCDPDRLVMRSKSMCVRPEHTRGTYNWATISLLAQLSLAVDDFSASSREATPHETPSKRSKLANGTDDVLRQSLSASSPIKIQALQIISFLLDERPCISDKFIDHLKEYADQMLDEDKVVATWTMVTLSSLVSLKAAEKSESRKSWLQVWHFASRNFSSPILSRSAAFLLDRILRSNVLLDVDTFRLIDTTLFSNGLNGPVGMSDAALLLWLTITNSRSASGQAATGQIVARLLNWLSTQYILTFIPDRVSSKQMALYATAPALLNLLLLCVGAPHKFRWYRNVAIPSPVFRAAFERERNTELSRYMIEGKLPPDGPMYRSDRAAVSRTDSQVARDTSNDQAVFELLLNKLQNFREAWIALSKERASNISADVIQTVVSLVLVCSALPKLLEVEQHPTGRDLIGAAHQLWTLVFDFIERSEGTENAETSAAAAAATVTALHKSISLEPDTAKLQGVSFVVSSLLVQLHSKDDTVEFPERGEPDVMEVEDSFKSYNIYATAESQSNLPSRQDIPFATSPFQFQSELHLQLHMSLSDGEAAKLAEERGVPMTIDYLVGLGSTEFLASRLAILEFLRRSHLPRSSAARLLEKIAEVCMQGYDLVRCESSLCLCLESLTAVAEVWNTEEDDDLHGIASDMYKWFIDVPLGRGLASSGALTSLSKLLERLLMLGPTHKNSLVPSSRTSLLKILRGCSNTVRFNMARQISSLFDQFALTEHTAILDDIVDALPNDSADLDGIALRLYILTTLAAHWNTLLRPCVYHVFETAAHIPLSMSHARNCLEKLSTASQLGSPQELLILFAPQLIYTWLGTESLESIPFSVFGFLSLRDLTAVVLDEIVAQIVMRPNMKVMDTLSQIMETPFVDMLELSFPKAEAYSVARDISIPPSKENASKNTESQIRKHLGRDRYLHLISVTFPKIVVALFTTLGDEEELERALTRRPEFAYAVRNLHSVRRLGSSKTVLPPRQQPFFRAKYLLDELDFLCQRVGKDLATIWTSQAVVFVCRNLLDSMVPALGLLHACSVLRKIRIVVILADQQVQQGYPLEMLLQALQPYLTRSYCSEDAVGLFWYLLDGGREYLQKHLAFLCRIALTSLLSLSAFLSAQKDKTTQEAHFISTLSIATSFRRWFAEYLITLPLQNYLVNDVELFRTLINYASAVELPGRADKHSTEGKLLLGLLEARHLGSVVISAAAFRSTITILCQNFRLPISRKENILGEDCLATRHSRSLWTLLRDTARAQSFWTWSAESLGRAYAASGEVDETLRREHPDDLFQSTRDGIAAQSTSTFLILAALRDLVLSDDPTHASMAELAIAGVITRLASQRVLGQYEEFFGVSMVETLNWQPLSQPITPTALHHSPLPPRQSPLGMGISLDQWASNLAVSLSSSMKDDPILDALPTILGQLTSFATRTLPFVVHSFLQADTDTDQGHRQTVSQVFRAVLVDRSPSSIAQRRLALRTLVYLRSQYLQSERTIADRVSWLDIDLGEAAAAAVSCAMYKSALMLLELQVDRNGSQSARPSRRSSAAKVGERPDLLRHIYQGLNDPDFFFGISNEASLSSVLRQLNYEGNSFKNLSFQSALFDSDIKSSEINDDSRLIQALNSANLSGIAQAFQVQSAQKTSQFRNAGIVNTHLTALNLHQWDLPATSSVTDAPSQTYDVLRVANTSSDTRGVLSKCDDALLRVVDNIVRGGCIGNFLQQSMSTLATLTEIKEVLSSRGFEELEENLLRLQHREQWQEIENFDQISLILANREGLFSTIKRKSYLSEFLGLSQIECQLLEVNCVRHSLKLARSHTALQPALNRSLFLFSLARGATKLGTSIGDVALFDFAGVLWDQGDITASVQMLKQVKDNTQSHSKKISVSRPSLLADLGYRVAVARLERPDEIINNYLLPAIKALRGEREGTEAGRVHHEFAHFCDQQLQSTEGSDEFSGVEEVRQQRQAEVSELERMVKNAQGNEEKQLSGHYTKAMQWYKLDDDEFQQLKQTRETFLQQTLENYLLSLQACDDYSNDVLRFCAVWLDSSSNATANAAVSEFISEVPSRKFVPLMNQLSSRLLDSHDEFQDCLFRLLLRICEDHPFHGMYQVFASSKSRGGKDDMALSRHSAANRLSEELCKGPASSIWVAVHNSNLSFTRFALCELSNNKYRSGSKAPLTRLPAGAKLVQEIGNLTTKIPPPTLKITVRVDRDYSSLPVLQRFEPNFTVAGGASAPKIITMIASDGSRMKALLKGGNDDLRQDSIMEQVFEQVSNLLKDHRKTRQRQLGIRTYKVLPLTLNAGIIEFVPKTIPLHDYSLPAHLKYHPKDWKANKCRKEIDDAQSKSQQTRIQTFRTVCNNFHPVLRHFFFEHFLDPDDWFTKRLAYSRSTAAISMLGHVLGLGDRHGHNILLDEETGEVVHIDLGIGFEAGRVLRVAEVVPFRLTRDIVDGMGISGVEGVFRRCCNFTLEALRQDQYSIMTILDVLRYDPLYSWSISPLRQQRMQEDKKQRQKQQQQQQREDAKEAGGDGIKAEAASASEDQIPTRDRLLTSNTTTNNGKKKNSVNNPGEADRALAVVARKLGKTLSVEATVNDLIQQAMDERNLAMLFGGWAAYV